MPPGPLDALRPPPHRKVGLMLLPLVAEPAPRIYNLFPTLAGPMAQWHDHLARIRAMRFDWIYLNPIHYPGFSGSLYAVKDYYALHPLLDDGSGRPADDQIRALLAAAHDHGLKVMLDLVVNHTAKDSPWVDAVPDWYVREADGGVQSPFAIDPANADNKTVWGDLAELDFSPRPARARMVAQFAAIVRHYVGLGFDGFRCDAAYKVPAEVWAELIGAARSVRPETVFVAETLGCRLPEIEGLRPAGFDYLFNSAKWWDFREDWLLEQYNAFRSLAPSIAFPESHDTPRLRAELPDTLAPDRIEAAYRRALLFSAVFSSGLMMPMGFEYGFAAKPDVVQTRPEDWETPAFDLTAYVGAVNDMKQRVRVLNWEGPQTFVDLGSDVAMLIRRAEHDPDVAVTLINRDPEAVGHVPVGLVRAAVPDLAERALGEVTPGRAKGRLEGTGGVTLGPGELRVFVHDPRDAK
ncbi:alpha-amylase family glycosyl hydrolase [Roseospira goensis]|uniref:Starch synthase (Maltosyl-transferring) n=1 Tax=Roseospira goensis TaxID=391922 RepID=A0A7W6S0F5_9PROT|nr:alpha-amylase family glycosyl hydrolase [Roseospira goensis]MBB4286578.1 starch synthase (maltosyl-transferring) [Roseospira goensis]